jgi:hypothetical protein
MITADEVMQIINVLLFQFNIRYDRNDYGNSSIFTVTRFGVKIVYLDGQEFDKKILNGWNVVYIHPDFDIIKSKERIVWGLVQGGYFHYLRNNYKKTFHYMISNEGWGKRIIQERLKRQKELPKYVYFGELNKDALKAAETWVMSQDPGFFDMMPEQII